MKTTIEPMEVPNERLSFSGVGEPGSDDSLSFDLGLRGVTCVVESAVGV